MTSGGRGYWCNVTILHILLLVALSLVGESHAGDTDPQPSSATLKPSQKVHIFFYAWYATAEPREAGWRHWKHAVLPHYKLQERAKFKFGDLMNPPEDIAAAYYPNRGLYSSLDPKVVSEQMKEIANAGIGVVVFSWWRDRSDEKVDPAKRPPDAGYIGTDAAVPVTLDAAAAAGIHVCFHMEPYDGRTELDFKDDIEYVLDEYGNHSAFYRNEEGLPLYYVYDSYHLPAESWARVLKPDAEESIRGTPLDGVFIGLYLNRGDEKYSTIGGFDGLYTYFASTSFSDGTRMSEWPRLSLWAEQNKKLFVPCVGPGYNDSRIRPWNKESWRSRNEGGYYNAMWKAALNSNPKIVAITSYNEWQEGTNIEPAMSDKVSTASGYRYDSYGKGEETKYLDLTLSWIKSWTMEKNREEKQHRDAMVKALMDEEIRLESLHQNMWTIAKQVYLDRTTLPQEQQAAVYHRIQQLHVNWKKLDEQRETLRLKLIEMKQEPMRTLPDARSDSGPFVNVDAFKDTRPVAQGIETEKECKTCYSTDQISDAVRSEACAACAKASGASSLYPEDEPPDKDAIEPNHGRYLSDEGKVTPQQDLPLSIETKCQSRESCGTPRVPPTWKQPTGGKGSQAGDDLKGDGEGERVVTQIVRKEARVSSHQPSQSHPPPSNSQVNMESNSKEEIQPGGDKETTRYEELKQEVRSLLEVLTTLKEHLLSTAIDKKHIDAITDSTKKLNNGLFKIKSDVSNLENKVEEQGRALKGFQDQLELQRKEFGRFARGLASSAAAFQDQS